MWSAQGRLCRPRGGTVWPTHRAGQLVGNLERLKNRYWPAEYVVDREGRIVHYHSGEGGYVETENVIESLVG